MVFAESVLGTKLADNLTRTVLADFNLPVV
jgi:hypothetical protein